MTLTPTLLASLKAANLRKLARWQKQIDEDDSSPLVPAMTDEQLTALAGAAGGALPTELLTFLKTDGARLTLGINGSLDDDDDDDDDSGVDDEDGDESEADDSDDDGDDDDGGDDDGGDDGDDDDDDDDDSRTYARMISWTDNEDIVSETRSLHEAAKQYGWDVPPCVVLSIESSEVIALCLDDSRLIHVSSGDDGEVTELESSLSSLIAAYIAVIDNEAEED